MANKNKQNNTKTHDDKKSVPNEKFKKLIVM